MVGWVCSYESSTPKDPEDGIDALELELQMVENHGNWRLGIELGSPVI